MFQIGQAARLSGVSAKQIRYYESVGLLLKSRREANGYRSYEERHVHELRFIKRARTLGFSIRQIRELLSLWRNKRRPSSSVRVLARKHKDSIEKRVRELEAMVVVLNRLIAACKGDERPDCPILDELER
jgi:MerR family transcriptional regulator, copper efflux regulator